ncbi:hydroxyisourate hydrolase [Marinobacter nanhaiticus D15-8W]|uniref:5-hydroxyisourate hydrolase n=1 Tax=Marinobacter nanhaiticus D15-8W TaxID=626887 RepID=N6VX92_9GAMM|nr:hydroxyisourate hydrolase [Marinobacter nanhaiticus]ENO14870.1 hydroxyisourate hydrolase [Marinobacter nanhaiticus D15-8W]BES69436.1 hydroxyisourate hydrolase [Marinobacter nanhaiticus D15-8W]
MSERSPITTHILDLGSGRPAAGVAVTLEGQNGNEWTPIANGATDDDGRIGQWFEGPLASGLYRLTFATGAYFEAQGKPCFYPQVTIDFSVSADQDHYHVPLLLNQWGYSTYRGS